MAAKFDVFLSHNSLDNALIREIADLLEGLELRVWFDEWELQPGRSWIEGMQAGIRDSLSAVVAISGHGLGPWEKPEMWAILGEGVERDIPVIPLLLPGAGEPPLFLKSYTWVDLRDGLSEAGLERLRWGITNVKPARPGRRHEASSPAVSLSKLPVTGQTFVAREDELARLDAAWADPHTNVISFVAMGGAGKSALVNHWLDRMKADGWRGAERVLGWSFYSQGTDSTGASSEAFTEFALPWLGHKGEVLAERVRERRTLLVLDGLEPLQHPPGAQTGRIKDPAVQALVKELAAKNPGLCVITTRLAVADVAGRAGAVSEDLDQLPPEAGAELLRRLGVKGSEKELRAAAQELGGHGLALTLLGTYLRDVLEGDVRRRREAVLLEEGIDGAEHAKRVMAAYEAMFGPGPERSALALLGLFDRPAEKAAVAALRAAPEIPGLTEGIATNNEKAWKLALARLRQARLVSEPDGNSHSLDAHPLVREHFGARLKEAAPESWREGNLRLYEHYQQAAPDLPETLEQMLPLYAAVVHGCRGGRVVEAYAEVFKRRIRRWNEGFSWRKLGAFGAELTALAAFFNHPWDQPSQDLSAADQAWILNTAGFHLRALGRLGEAVGPMRAGLALRIAQKKWGNAARIASNLSELLLTLGQVAEAVAAGKESVVLADRSEEWDRRMVSRTTLADALHGAGRWEESAALFREAEGMQANWQKEYPRLYSLGGYQYCDLLLGQAEPEDGAGLAGVLVSDIAASGVGAHGRAPHGSTADRGPAGNGGRAHGRAPLRGEDSARYRQACEEVRGRAEQFFEWRVPGDSLLDIALDHLSLGRAHLGLALTAPEAPDFAPAGEHLDRAVEGLRQAGQEQYLPNGLLARAAFYRLTGNLPAAAVDLGEALEIAERSGMRLHEADAHLEWTRLHLQQDDPATARTHLARARELVTACRYGRREREVRWLAGRVGE
ncbi:MAG TPA: toll/interleukin-1 receptor domain-containing protein [Thermoanaerobaculia bacterium]|nr:toll/interleukin-1 receptor domain-containing protein [Thermoanaerobaculia bacterium]